MVPPFPNTFLKELARICINYVRGNVKDQPLKELRQYYI